MSKKIKISVYSSIKILIVSTLLSFFVFYYLLSNYSINCSKDIHFTIPSGASLGKVIQILSEEECFEGGEKLKWLMKIKRNDRNIRPGKYTLPKNSKLHELVAIITTDSMELTKVTLLEGWTVNQIARKMGEVLKIDTTRFVDLCYSDSFIKSLGINANSLEGYLYPETYSFSSNRISFDLTEKEIIRVLVTELKRQYAKSIKKSKLSMHEAITLASIIQGECIFISEMDTVSSVYHNRLNKNWLLQADPTIQYLKPGKNKRLYNKDYTRFDSPYNTYMYKGLPPGPISNPGIDAIIAAVYPASSNYMFFVAKGDGRHYFTKTEKEHNNAKKKYLKKVW